VKKSIRETLPDELRRIRISIKRWTDWELEEHSEVVDIEVAGLWTTARRVSEIALAEYRRDIEQFILSNEPWVERYVRHQTTRLEKHFLKGAKSGYPMWAKRGEDHRGVAERFLALLYRGKRQLWAILEVLDVSPAASRRVALAGCVYMITTGDCRSEDQTLARALFDKLDTPDLKE
jgi:hypothetical protein